MNLKEIREEAWDEAREVGATDDQRLWTTAEMNRYINRVYRRIARETLCIQDSVTPSICRITSAPPASLAALTTAAATDSWAAQDLAWYNDSNSWLNGKLVAPYSYAISPLVLKVIEAKWTIRQWKLTKVSITKWQHNPWWEQVTGMPTEFATDADENRLFLNFRSDSTDTLKLTVKRLPIANLEADKDVPEFRENYHDMFKNGVLELMYKKKDSQTFDEAKALDYGKMFLDDIDRVKQEEEKLQTRLNVNYAHGAFR